MSHEWSRWEASDIDRKAERPSEREQTSQHGRANGRGWVDNHQDCPEGELRGPATLVKITEDVRKYAAEQNLSENQALEIGMEQKAREFIDKVPRYMPKPEAEGIEPTGMRRDRRASPRGRECRAAFESMQEKRKEFLEQGAEIYAKT